MEATGLRRRTVLLGGGAAAMSIAGCAVAPTREVRDGDVCAPGGRAFLATEEVRGAWAKPERYFDAHTHFFNARDLPVAGYLTKSMGHYVQPLQPLIAPLGRILERIGHQHAPTAAEELADLCRMAGDPALFAAPGKTLDERIRAHQEGVAESLARALHGGPMQFFLRERSREIASTRKALVAPAGKLELDADFILYAMRRGTVHADPRHEAMPPGASSLAGLTASERQVDAVGGLLAFGAALLGPRHHNVRSFIANFAAKSRELPLSGCFAAMVDFNYWLRQPPSITHMRDQVLLHEQLSLLSGGFVLPLVGYNPWVDMREKGLGEGESLETLRWAVKEHGCVGAKIYPPMGFFPYGNTLIHHQLEGITQNRPSNLEELDKRLARFHETCADLGVPVMAHANDTMGRDAEHDRIGGPSGWQATGALMRQRGKTLTVNLGHFGGAEHGTKPDPHDWTQPFADMMASSPGLKVYGDIGNWKEMLENKPVQDALANLLRRPLATPGQTVAHRVMYGTDWHMLAKKRDWPLYAGQMLEIFRKMDLPDGAIAAVFGGNAMDCFGLSPNGPNRKRFRDDFARRSGGQAPGWM